MDSRRDDKLPPLGLGGWLLIAVPVVVWYLALCALIIFLVTHRW